MRRICLHPLVLGGWRTEQPSPECFLLPVQVPSSEFCKFFQKKFRFPNGTLESLKMYDPHMGQSFWPSFPYLEGWYVEFMGRKSVAYLCYLSCQAEWWSMKDWNLIRFRSCGVSRDGGNGLTLGKEIWSFIWTPCLQLFGRVGFSSLIFNSFLENNHPALFLNWF